MQIGKKEGKRKRNEREISGVGREEKIERDDTPLSAAIKIGS